MPKLSKRKLTQKAKIQKLLHLRREGRVEREEGGGSDALDEQARATRSLMLRADALPTRHVLPPACEDRSPVQQTPSQPHGRAKRGRKRLIEEATHIFPKSKKLPWKLAVEMIPDGMHEENSRTAAGYESASYLTAAEKSSEEIDIKEEPIDDHLEFKDEPTDNLKIKDEPLVMDEDYVAVSWPIIMMTTEETTGVGHAKEQALEGNSNVKLEPCDRDETEDMTAELREIAEALMRVFTKYGNAGTRLGLKIFKERLMSIKSTKELSSFLDDMGHP